MSALAETLDSLRLDDGKSDIAGRRVRLDGLKDALSSHEIRRLRSQLNEITFKTDIYGELPAEILMIVVDHLELDDIVKARFVSRKWREVFSTPEFCLGVIKKHFPSDWARGYNILDVSRRDAAKVCFSKWLPGAALDRLKRLHGRYESMSTFYYNYERGSMPSQLENERQYNSGRVALRTQKYGIITKDLRTGTVTEILDENRADITNWLLSDQYLILSNVSPNILCAWPLDSSIDKESSYSVRLPNRALNISAHGKQVGVVTYGGHLFIWTIGGLMKSVDTSAIHNYLAGFKQSQTTIIFHPGDDDHYFIVNDGRYGGLEDNPKESQSVVIQEYISGKLSATSHANLFPFIRRKGYNPILSGRIITCSIKRVKPKRYEDHRSPYQHACNSSDESVMQLEDMVLLTFDIWTKNFAFQTHHLPVDTWTALQEVSRNKMTADEAFIWNNQALLPIHRPGFQELGNMLVLACNSCDGVSGQSKNIPWYGKNDLSGKEISYLPEGEGPFQIRGDDDFVVLFGKYGMTVWCFEKMVHLPISWSEMNPSVPEAL